MKHFNLSHFFFILFITVSITPASAEQRSYADALSIAEQVMGKVVFSEISTNVAATRNGSPVSDLVPYYIFDKEDGNGFAIISGSSLMRPIIGYSDNTSFKTDNLPDNLQHWFEMVSAAATFLENHPEYALSTNQQAASTTVIEPLLGNIMWDQGTPYNNLCPKVKGTRCPTGCVATAAAQCMYYWQYPTQGSGSNSYTTSAGSSLSVDFSKQSYDYSLMYDQYTTSATAAQNAEVAKLSYHAGVAVNMDYTASSSGATVYDLHRGMIKNFSYDTKTSILFREYFTLEEWEAAILNELQNSRPVLFCGVDESDGGHCFVLDGIDSDGLYHVNWGWDGQLNGYFDVTILNAEGAGTGASSNNDGFSYSQQMLVNTAPQGKLSNGRYYPTLYSYYEDETLNISTGSVSLGGKITVSSSFIANFSYFDLTGTVGLAYVQNDEIADFSKIQYYGNGKYYDFTFDDDEPLHALDSLIYGFSLDKDVSVVPTSLSEGTYKVYLAFKDAGTSEVGLIHYYAKNDSYCTCVVANGKATFTEANTDMPLSFSAWSMSSESINVYDSKTVTCNIKNADSENTFVGRFFLNLTSPSGSSTWTEADSVIKIAPNASYTKNSQLAIIVCGDKNISERLWEQDCCAVTENILLAVEALELGAVWCMAYPSDERVAGIRSLFNLPENIIPLNIIPIGYALTQEEPKQKYNADKVHVNNW